MKNMLIRYIKIRYQLLQAVSALLVSKERRVKGECHILNNDVMTDFTSQDFK